MAGRSLWRANVAEVCRATPPLPSPPLRLSIGANTAIFSAANALLLRPLPVENIDRLVIPITLREGFDPFGSPFLEYAAYRDRAHCLASSGIATVRSFNLTGQR